MEKKRRARINESLRELRTLLADTDVSRTRTRASPACTGTRCGMVLMQLLSVSTDSFQDGERRGAGDDSEKGGGHTEESKPRFVPRRTVHHQML